MMNKRYEHNITDRTVSVKSQSEQALPEPLPQLKGMNGGQKQHFNRENRDLIVMVYEKYGDEYAKAMFNLKDATLAGILKKSERQGRKNITLTDRAFNNAYRANERLYELEPQVAQLQDALIQHFQDDQELRETLSDFFRLSAQINDMAAKLVMNRGSVMSNFTERI